MCLVLKKSMESLMESYRLSINMFLELNCIQVLKKKAANLFYFLIKDHPFVDGCKRIGASIFLEFLNKNKHLIIDGKQIISDSALVAITLMIASLDQKKRKRWSNLS